MIMTGYKWHPIEDLPEDWQRLASSELAGLFAVWKEQVVRLKDSPAYLEFQARLRREWAIETGIIEGLYDIDRGVTRTLIERGLHASLIAHGDANKPAEEIIPMLKDHEMVVEGLFDFVGQQRHLSTSYIKQIHQALTTHQETATGVDSFGHRTQIPLLRGEWKKWPNNPTREDGSVHEYCPPEQTASEMDRLIEMHQQHLEAGVPPGVEAVWLHHRFTQIHPFQDGNGRVARALASLIFIRAGWFPFVVNRDERLEYIEGLEKADLGDITSLLAMFGRMQKRAFNQAINLSSNVLLPADSVEQLIEFGARSLKEQETDLGMFPNLHKFELDDEDYRISKNIILILKEALNERLDKLVNDFKSIIDKTQLYQSPVIEKREQTKDNYKFYSVKVDSLLFDFDFRISSKAGNKLVYSKVYLTRPNDLGRQVLGKDPFQCANSESLDLIENRFRQWLEEALILGFEEWRKTLEPKHL